MLTLASPPLLSPHNPKADDEFGRDDSRPLRLGLHPDLVMWSDVEVFTKASTRQDRCGWKVGRNLTNDALSGMQQLSRGLGIDTIIQRDTKKEEGIH